MQMPQLDISSFPTQIFWTLITFFALYIFVRYIFDPKLLKAKGDREKIIKNNIELSEKLREEAKYIEDSIDDKIEKAKKDVEELISHNERRFAEKMADELIKIEQDLAKKYHFAENNIKNKLLSGFDGQIKDISTSIASDIMQRLVGSGYNKEIIEKYVAEAAEARIKDLVNEE